MRDTTNEPAIKIRPIQQNLIDCPSKPIKTLIVAEKALTAGYFSKFKPYEPLGVAPAYRPDGRIAALAVCNDGFAVVIELPGKAASSTQLRKNLVPLQDLLLRNQGLFLGFDCDLLAMALYRDLSIRVTCFVDVQSTFPESEQDRHPIDAIAAGINMEHKIFNDNIDSTFQTDVYDKEQENNNNSIDEVVLRAWVAQRLYHVQGTETTFDQAAKINTTSEFMPTQQLDLLAPLISVVHRLDQAKPREQSHQIRSFAGNFDQSTLDVKSTRYSNRVRRGGEHQRLRVDFGNMKMDGRATKVVGSRVVVTNPNEEFGSGFGGRAAVTVTTIGKEAPTQAEMERRKVLLKTLQGHTKMFDENAWVQNLWSRSKADDMVWPPDWPALLPIEEELLNVPKETMNNSQVSAIEHMSTQRITLVHGPPGTGKTTVIGKFVELWTSQSANPGIWLVAQSNIAVKNIAEKLAKLGFLNWKVIVSVDFMFEWHSHLYEGIQNHIIQSRDLGGKPAEIAKMLRGCQVVLCTLSMLSNSKINRVTAYVPLQCLIVDEASQINVGDYLSVFNTFGNSLKKVSFIGDDKQLPPHGQDTISNLQSIFEFDILQPFSVLLDTQYRIPPQIGAFISTAVYENKLHSNPLHPVKDDVVACQFINASGNERSIKTSFANDEEIKAVLLLARHLQDEEKLYKVITPYDAQRNEIEKAMQTAELDWESKVFNVDSFQGNEEDYIVISLVRTQSLGFLTSRRRSNVMLSRCKKGMYIVSKQTFMDRKCGETLVGELAAAIEERIGISDTWLSIQDLENGKFQIHKPVAVAV